MTLALSWDTTVKSGLRSNVPVVHAFAVATVDLSPATVPWSASVKAGSVAVTVPLSRSSAYLLATATITKMGVPAFPKSCMSLAAVGTIRRYAAHAAKSPAEAGSGPGAADGALDVAADGALDVAAPDFVPPPHPVSDAASSPVTASARG